MTKLPNLTLFVRSLDKRIIILALLFLLSFSLRIVGGFRNMIFWQDQARDAYLMRQFHEQGVKFIAYGPKASVGNFYLPPLYYQVNYFFSSIFGFRPLIMQWVIVLVESFTPVILFLILERLTNRRLALTASIIYSLSFLPILYGSSAWNPNMTPCLTSLALLFFLRHLQEKSKWSIIFGIFSIGMAISFHYQAVVVIPFVILVFFMSLRRSIANLKFWVLGGFLFALTLLPYFMAEINAHWANAQAVIRYFSEIHSQYYDRVTKPQFVLTFIPEFFERVLLGTNVRGILLGRIILFLGGVAALISGFKHKKSWILLVYFGLIFVMLRVYKGDKMDYYMSTLFILPAYLLAVLLFPLKRLVVIPLCLFAIVSAFLTFSHPPQQGFQTFVTASAYIQSQLPKQDAVVFFHDLELVNLFAYAFIYQNPIHLNPISQYAVDLCSLRQPCDERYRNLCWSDLSTRISLLKYKYSYSQTEAMIFGDRFEVVIGKLKSHSEEIKYLDDTFQSTTGSDILLRDFIKQ